jgi:membrane-bound lytic murein transglycosylase A
MQVQGSGRVRMADGSVLRLAYGLKSGLPYTSIGKVLIDRGEMTREEMSMQALRGWLDDHPDEARQIMWQNESYVFFRELKDTDPALGPVGAQQVPLTPFRSLAVDRSFWALGVPVWVSTTVFRDAKHGRSSMHSWSRKIQARQFVDRNAVTSFSALAIRRA